MSLRLLLFLYLSFSFLFFLKVVCCLEKSGRFLESVVVCIDPQGTHRVEVARRGKVLCSVLEI